jgi:hypothetical protein
LGKINAPDLADAVVNRLSSFKTNITTPPNQEVSFTAFSQIIMNVLSTLETSKREMVQTFLSSATPVKPQAAGTRYDPRLKRSQPQEEESKKRQREATPPSDEEPDEMFEDEPEPEPVPKQEAPVVQKEFVLKTKQLDKQERQFLVDMGWERILGAEKDLEREGKQFLRIALLTRMVSQREEKSQWYNDLLHHIRSDFKSRYELALQWLTTEYTKNSQDVERYSNLLHNIIEMARGLGPEDFLIRDLACQCPKVTNYCLRVVCEYIEDDSRITTGLVTLRDLIMRREPIRQDCLNYLLEYTTHDSMFMNSITNSYS